MTLFEYRFGIGDLVKDKRGILGKIVDRRRDPPRLCDYRIKVDRDMALDFDVITDGDGCVWKFQDEIELVRKAGA